jgi:predicted permease
MGELWRKLRFLLNRSRLDRELAEEMQFHIEQKARDTGDRVAARRQFGNSTLLREASREIWGWPSLERLAQDVRYALRIIRRNPAFSAVAVLTLALGIGANAAMFSLFDAVLLRLLPVRDPQQLYVLQETGPLQENDDPAAVSFPVFQRFGKALAGSAELAALTRPAPFHIRIGGAAAEPVSGQLVSGEFFSVLGIRPVLGRLLTPEDNRALGNHPVMVLSHGYWNRRFGGDPRVLGSVLPVNGAALTVVGVAEACFSGVSVGEPADLWLPLLMQAQIRYAQNAWLSNADTRKPWPPQEGIRWLEVMARVPGARALPEVAAALNVLHRQDMEHAGQSRNERERRLLLERRLSLEQGGQGFSTLRRRLSTPLRVLMAMVGIVLLIACTNVAGLLLARATARRREIAIRLAIGAGRGRLVRQLLTESVVLASLGGAFAILIAAWANQGLPRLFSLNVTLQFDYRLLGFTAVLSLATGILFGLAPAFRLTRVVPGVAFKPGSFAGEPGRRLTLGKTLIIVQVVLSLVLVSGAGLLARTLWNLRQTDLGFDREHVITVRIDPRSAGFPASQLPGLYAQLVERIGALPGVRSATIAFSSIAGGGTVSSGINVPGYTPGPRENMSIDENYVDPGYFATVGIPLVEGRDFDGRDHEKAPKVAIINETMARRFFSSASPLGRTYGYGSLQFQIVGVVRDARLKGPRSRPGPMAYRPIRQEMDYARSLEVRTKADPRVVAPEIRKVIAQVAPALPVQDVATLAERVGRLLARERLVTQITAIFGLLALLLACIGIYGLISYAVARRTAEMGIRMALGATRASVVWLVLREAIVLVLIGLAVGIPLVFAAARLVTGLLFGVSPTDPLTLVSTALLMLSIAVLAAYPPARRASRVDPITALRYE